MVAHIILFKPRHGLTHTEWTAIVNSLKQVAGTIRSIQKFRVGRRVRHGIPGYEQAMPEDYEYAAVLEFKDVEALEDYLRNPAHVAIGRHFTESASAALAYDYELVDVTEAEALVQEG